MGSNLAHTQQEENNATHATSFMQYHILSRDHWGVAKEQSFSFLGPLGLPMRRNPFSFSDFHFQILKIEILKMSNLSICQINKNLII